MYGFRDPRFDVDGQDQTDDEQIENDRTRQWIKQLCDMMLRGARVSHDSTKRILHKFLKAAPRDRMTLFSAAVCREVVRALEIPRRSVAVHPPQPAAGALETVNPPSPRVETVNPPLPPRITNFPAPRDFVTWQK
jgi:hypothetical protein